MTLTAQHNQAYIDLCLMALGDVSQLFAVTAALGVAVTDAPAAGEAVTLPDLPVQPAAARIAALLRTAVYVPASDGEAATVAGEMPPVRPVAVVPAADDLLAMPGQAVVDLAMQQYGDAGLMLALAMQLQLSVTDELPTSTALQVPELDDVAVQLAIAQVLQRPTNRPASQLDVDGPPLTDKGEGIGYWYLYEYEVQ